MILMLKASSLSHRLTDVRVTKRTDTHVWPSGDRHVISNGYVRFFGHNEREPAKEWIVNQNNKMETSDKITKEDIVEIKDKELSDEERATGKLRTVKKRRVRGSTQTRSRRKR